MSLSKNSPLVKRSLCTYPFTTKSKAFFFLNFRMWRLLLICIHFLALFQKGGGKKKLLPFLFTSLLVAININDWGLCDDEIPPSSLRAAVTYPADVSVDGLQHFFETDLCWHPWRCTRWSIAAVEGTKNPDRCFTFKKKKKKSILDQNQSTIMKSKMADYLLDSLLSMERYSLYHIRSTY